MAEALDSPARKPQPARNASPDLSEAEGWWARQGNLPRVVYWTIHAASLLVFVVGFSTGDLLLCAGTFLVRMFAITGVYHRYFSHTSYKTSRPVQFLLALLGTTATQKGPIWWASRHRQHHKYADRAGRDPHSPREGFWYAHQGWIFDGRWDSSALEQIPDFSRYPELMWLNRWHIVGPIALALFCLAVGGVSGLVWGFALSTTLLWHTTYSINSLCHLWGTRRFETPDTSRNNALLALLTMGEGWHNNHHHFCTSARQGFRWWEIDVTYYVLRGMQAVGLIWDVREPPEHIRLGGGPAAAKLDRAA